MSAFCATKVLDCTMGLAGSMAAMLLGDLGAEVLKLEPEPKDPRARAGHVAWNRNKHRLTLDVEDPEARQRFDRLLAGADLAVFDHGPSDMRRLGLDGPTLSAAHPRLIHLWTPPLGTVGGWSDLPAHHGALAGLVGAAHRQGSYADQPVWYVNPIGQYTQATMAAAAAAAALLDRSHTGLGRTVTVSGLHAMAGTSCPARVPNQPPVPVRRPIGQAPHYRLYRCGDGQWLFLAALLPHFLRKALEVLDLVGTEGDLAVAIERKLQSAPRDAWIARFRSNDVPAGPVERREDWLQNDIIQTNGLAIELAHPELGPVEMPGVAAKLRATPGTVRHVMTEATPERLAAFAAPISDPARPASVGRQARSLPLAGVRVLDLGTVVAGPYAAAILANFGADVIKVETAEGDSTRNGATGIGAFINFNRGKRGLGLDLKADAGRRVFLDLARSADVVMDNYRLGVRKRLGIDYAALKAVNPRIISCSANSFGSKGSMAGLPGFDPLLQAYSGMMAAQGGDGGEPVFNTIAVNDAAMAVLTAFGVIAALNAREHTGEGQDVETSLAAASTLYQFEELTNFRDRPANPAGARDCLGFAALERYYACSDGWLTLVVATPAQFAACAMALGRPDWLARWDGAAALAEPRDGILAAELAAGFATRERRDAIAALSSAGVLAIPVLTTEEVYGDAFLRANDYFEDATYPGLGAITTSRGYAAFDGATARFGRPSPRLGEHAVVVLKECGLSRERIADLVEEGVVFGDGLRAAAGMRLPGTAPG
jgi:crotonobetainyl-CoA:carnitine CoA-transferase CaiB-like acyl-CoA transferase